MGFMIAVTRSIVVTGAVVEALRAEAGMATPRECCGLLLGREGRIDLAVPARNVAADPFNRFEIDPQALIAAHREARAGGRAVIGYYHSHPTGAALPSATDRAHAAGDGRIWAIVAPGAADPDAIGWWRDAPDGFERLPSPTIDG